MPTKLGHYRVVSRVLRFVAHSDILGWCSRIIFWVFPCRRVDLYCIPYLYLYSYFVLTVSWYLYMAESPVLYMYMLVTNVCNRVVYFLYIYHTRDVYYSAFIPCVDDPSLSLASGLNLSEVIKVP